jgi:phage-related protein
MKPVFWVGDALEKLRRYSREVRAEVGHELELVQRGEKPSDFRPMPDVGSGVVEIRIHAGGEYRIFYVARFEEAIYVLHCFQKKTRTTARLDLQLGKRRYQAMVYRRKNEDHEK